MGSNVRVLTRIRMSYKKEVLAFILFLVTKATYSCNKVRQDSPKPVAFDPRQTVREYQTENLTTTSTTTTTTTASTTTSTTTMDPIPAVPTVLEAKKEGSELMIDWSNGVKMVILMEDLGDCFQVGSLPWDRQGSVSFTGCEEDDINVDIRSQIYGNWTVNASTV